MVNPQFATLCLCIGTIEFHVNAPLLVFHDRGVGYVIDMEGDDILVDVHLVVSSLFRWTRQNL